MLMGDVGAFDALLCNVLQSLGVELGVGPQQPFNIIA